MKAKEWAKANGFPDISLGKGRMPTAAREAVEAAVARGVAIEGYTVKASVATDKPATVERVKVSDTGIADIGEPSRPELEELDHGQLLTEAFAGDRNIGMRAVCVDCKSSLTYCPCKYPKVFIDVDRQAVVTFKSRKVPSNYRANKWW